MGRRTGSAFIAMLAVVLSACASPAPKSADVPASPVEAASPVESPGPAEQVPTTAVSGELVGVGLVRQEVGELTKFCLTAVADSYPPLCTGPTIRGWDWSTVDGETTTATVTWGDYVVYGTWNGSDFTVTRPPRKIAPNEPWGKPDPRQDPHHPGTVDKARLEQIQRELWNSRDPDLGNTLLNNGYLFLDVPHDDGTMQRAMDDRFGAGLVTVRSLLTPAD